MIARTSTFCIMGIRIHKHLKNGTAVRLHWCTRSLQDDNGILRTPLRWRPDRDEGLLSNRIFNIYTICILFNMTHLFSIILIQLVSIWHFYSLSFWYSSFQEDTFILYHQNDTLFPKNYYTTIPCHIDTLFCHLSFTICTHFHKEGEGDVKNAIWHSSLQGLQRNNRGIKPSPTPHMSGVSLSVNSVSVLCTWCSIYTPDINRVDLYLERS